MKLCLQCRAAFESNNWLCPNCCYEPELLAGFPSFAPRLASSNDGTPEGAHHFLNQTQSASFWFRARNRLIQDIIHRHFREARDVLEVGCGSGFVLSGIRDALPQARLVAAEAYSHGLLHAIKRVSPPCEFLQMDARALPYTGEFDLIGAFDVLEHIDDDEAVMAEMARALRPSGGLLLMVPQHRWLWSQSDELARHRRRYSPGQLAKALRQRGFHVVRETSFVFFLLPVMIAQRLTVGRRQDYEPGREFALPALLDRIFESLLDVERQLIRFGMRLPVGGSQVIIARKAG